MLAWILDQAGSQPGFLIGGVPLDFGVSARLTGQRVLRDRGRRVRHRVLRQALEVRPLPAAHRDPQQSRVRPRRHLSRPRGDRDAVPSSGAHGARTRAARRQRRRRRASRACSRAAAGARSSASASRRSPDTGADWTIAVDGTIKLGGAPQGALAPFALLGRHNQLNALAAIAAARHVGVPVAQSLAALAAFRGVTRRLEVRGTRRRRHRLRRFRAPSDGDRHHARRRCAATSAARASSPCSSRARTR